MSLVSIDEMVAKGMGRAATVGAFSTGIVGGGAGTVLDLDQPELVIGVPSGYAIRILYIACQVQTGLVAADNDESEILFAVDSKGLWSGDGTSTAEEPSNLRSDLFAGSACRVGSAFTADMTTTQPGVTAADPILDIELGRKVVTFDIFSTGVNAFDKELSLVYQPNYPPFVVGPASVVCYFGGTTANGGGFLQVHWVEGRRNELLPPL